MSDSLSLAEITAVGAHQTGHFLLSSGLHSADYLQCALYLAEPERAERAGRLLAAVISDLELSPQLVVAPAMGGLIIGHETARALGAPFIFSERSSGAMTLRRGFTVAPGQSVVVVEDVVTTGTSTREVIELIGAGGASVIGVASLLNRSRQRNPFAPLPYGALLEVDFPTWEAADCPLCATGQPLTKPGSRPLRG
jgi:orotate phosphoribosyltransferase